MSTHSRSAGLASDVQRALLHGLLDDASLFPPGNLPMTAAVAAHVNHEKEWFSALTGPFVCAETKLTDLARAMTAANTPWIDLALVVTGGAGVVSAATDAVAADPRLRLRAIEVPAAKGAEPARAVAEVAAALDKVPLADATGYIEYPLTVIADPDAAGPLLDVADQRGYRPKLRTGGVTPEAFPSELTLAGCLAAIAGRRIRFKCTAGLHHAVRCTSGGATGSPDARASDNAEAAELEQHGFLNVLLATCAAVDGADVAEIAAILGQRDRAAVAAAIQALDAETAAEIRWLFTSFGTCSINEPVADLVSLGLLSRP
ncbi:MAG: hypothetical protein ACTHJW_09430 [Streptosporangiaceae bacterium]